MITAGHADAIKDRYSGAIAVVPLIVRKRRKKRAPSGARSPRRERILAAFAALCETVFAYVPGPDGSGAPAREIRAAIKASGVDVSRRQFWRALARLVQDRRVQRAGRRCPVTTYRRTLP